MEAISLEGKGLLAKNMGFRIETYAIMGQNGDHLTGVNDLNQMRWLFYTVAVVW